MSDRPRREPADADFAEVFAEAVRARGVSLAWLRERLATRGNPVSLSTLSYWRSGRRRPEGPASMSALEDAEALLRLPRGELTSRLGPSRRTGPPGPRADVDEVVADQSALVRQALEDLDLAGPPELAVASLRIVIDVDSQRRVRAITINGVWRGMIDGAQRLPLVYVNDTPVGVMPDISVSGGRLGRDCSRPEHGLVAREVVLDRPLALREEAVAEQRTVFHDDVWDAEYEHYFTSRVDEFTLWVRFQADCMPLRAVALTTADGGEDAGELDLVGTTSVSLVLRRFGPGRAGITWEWGPADGE